MQKYLCAMSCCLVLLARYAKGETRIVSTQRQHEVANSAIGRDKQTRTPARQSPPVLLSLPSSSCDNAVVDLGHMHFNEVVRVPWVITNHTRQQLQLLDIMTDCACTAAKPQNDVAGSGETLTGYLDYKQGNLGASRRTVLFRTVGQDLALEIVSTKACDHYLHPNPMILKDSESVEVAFHTLYLKSDRMHEFHISKIEFDPNYLVLRETRPVVPTHRSVQDGNAILEYDENIVRMAFGAAGNCPIGRFETDIRIAVSDLRGSLPDYAYHVPVFLSVSRGISVMPAAVTVGVLDVRTIEAPLVSEITIRGLEGRAIGAVRTMPEMFCVVSQVVTTSEDTAVIRVSIDKPPMLLRTHLVVDLLPKGTDSDSGEAIFIPILGVFTHGERDQAEQGRAGSTG